MGKGVTKTITGLFDRKYVHFMWDDELEGKEGFFADDICELTNCVLGGDFHHAKVRKSISPAFPFRDDTNNNDWQFFYFDPNYEVKKAYAEGKQIQYKAKDTGRWCDWDDNLCSCTFRDSVKYRIKPGAENTGYTVPKDTLGLKEAYLAGAESREKRIEKLEKENVVLEKALRLYVEWADECGIAWNNFPDMEEKWLKVVEEKGLGWIDGLVFMVTEEAKDLLKKEL